MDPSLPGELIPLLESPDLEERLNAIRILGEMGDVEALAVLRTRLKNVSAEHIARIVSVGKFKRRLKINNNPHPSRLFTRALPRAQSRAKNRWQGLKEPLTPRDINP